MSKFLLSIRRTEAFQKAKNKVLFFNKGIQYFINPYSEKVGSSPIFIFNHIPKCGGTSFNLILRNWFYLKKDYSPHEIIFRDEKRLEEEFEKFENFSPDLKTLKPWVILAGHYHNSRFRLSRRFPDIYENQKVKLITFVRDPLSHHLSMYKFGKKKGHDFVKGLSLSDYLKKDSNFLATTLECTLENYKSRIDGYFFAGIVEEYEESLKQLSSKLGKAMVEKIPIENQTNSNTLYVSLSEEEINLFKESNKLDYLIYDYCLTKLQNKVA